MQISMTRPNGALEEEIEQIGSEDDNEGFEEEPEGLSIRICSIDSRCPCDYTFEDRKGCPPPAPPRRCNTLRIIIPAPGPRMAQSCGACQGKGGAEIDTSADGVTRKSWQTCTACNGTGVSS